MAKAASQMVLPLGWDGRDSGGFLVSACNEQAVRHLEHPSLWPVKASILIGPPRSGRTLLGAAFKAATGGQVIDNAQSHNQALLFHAWNHAAQPGNPPLLMIADDPVAHWRLTLADLQSRLAAAPAVHIDQPDDDLMLALIDRQFAARGTLVEPGMAAYLIPRIERSYQAIDAVVDAIDAQALAQRRRITRVLAREALFAAGLIGLHMTSDKEA
jgi:hypothetical protein